MICTRKNIKRLFGIPSSSHHFDSTYFEENLDRQRYGGSCQTGMLKTEFKAVNCWILKVVGTTEPMTTIKTF